MGGSNCKSFSPKNSGKSKQPAVTSNNFSSKSEEDSDDKSEYIEDVVCKEADINENEMKLFPLGTEGSKILIVKQKGEIYALGSKCTHYGALLNTGALGEGRVRCPWHGACFNIKTGDIEDYPGLDSLPSYKVTVDNGQVKVRAKMSELKANRRTKLMSCMIDDHPDTAVIVGGGPSGATCAETLRQEGFQGRIVMICKENVLPYDRVKVSKALDFDVQKALLRSEDFYKANNIDVKLGVEATKLDPNNKSITLSNCETLCYKYLYLATGSKPRQAELPGANLTNIFVVRDYTDAAAINNQLSSDKHIVILGTGFIGMEAAAYCVDKCASVTLISKQSTPLKAVFGTEIGNRIKQEFQNKGVKFIDGCGINKFIAKENDSKVVGKVGLTDGTVLEADLVILGIGSTLNTEWLKCSGLNLKDDGSVCVNENLKTNLENVYAGGDIAYAPVYAAGVCASIGHYALAHYHGKIAAMNISGKETSLRAVPFFWTMLFGKSYRYAGYGEPTNIKVHGSLDELKFFAYYFKNGKVIAMSSVGTDPIVADFANFLYEGKILTEEQVEKDPTEWMRNKPKDLQNLLSNTTQESKS